MESNVVRLKLIYLLDGLAFFVPVVTLYFLQGGVSLPVIVFSQVVYSIASFAADIPTGIFADKIGHKYAVLCGLVLNVAKYMIFLAMPNAVGLFLSYAISGMAGAFLSGSADAMMYESSNPGTYKKHASAMLANNTLGFAIGTGFTGVFLALVGVQYQSLLYISLLGSILALGVGFSLIPTKPKRKVAAQATRSLVILRESFTLIAKNRTIRALTWVTVLTLSGEYFLYSVYQPLFEQRSVAPLFFGLALSIGSVFNFFMLRYTYLLERFLTLEKIVLLVNTVSIIGFVCLAFFVSPVVSVLAFILLKGSFSAAQPIINDFIHEHTESHIRATVMSGISQIKNFSNIGARIILSLLVASFGIQATLGLQAAYLGVGLGIGYWLMVRCGCTNRISQHFESIRAKKDLLQQ